MSMTELNRPGCFEQCEYKDRANAGLTFQPYVEENPHDAGKRGVISTGHGACRITSSVVLPKKVASKNC
jgi:hypothetical protein